MKFHLALARCLGLWKKRGYSRVHLAKEIDCSVSSISHWANDRRPIEHHLAKKLFRVFNAQLTKPEEKIALLELADGYLENFPDRSTEEIESTLGYHDDDVSGSDHERNGAIDASVRDLALQQPAATNDVMFNKLMSPYLASLSLLLIVIFHSKIASGLNSVWNQVWVDGQFAPLSLALWSLLFFFALFFFFGLEGQGASNRASWVERGTWRDQYISTVNYALDFIDKLVLSEKRAKKLPLTSFSRNWSIELYEKTFLVAILYPIFAVMIQWMITGSAQAFGQFLIWPGEELVWRRFLIFGTLASSLPMAFLARKQNKKRWRISICVLAIIINFVGYISCWMFYGKVDVGPGAINMASIIFIFGIGLRAFDNVAVPIASVSIAGTILSFAFLPLVTLAEFITGKPGAGYGDFEVNLTHTILNHSLNLLLFFLSLKILSKYISRQRIEERKNFGVTIYVGIMVGIVVLIFIAATQGYWREYYLFLGLIPLMNGVFDFFSIGLTRFALRLGTQHFGLRTIYMSIVDLILALLLFVMLVILALVVMKFLNLVSGEVIFPLNTNTAGCRIDGVFYSAHQLAEISHITNIEKAICGDQFLSQMFNNPKELSWLFFIFASTLIPTFIHLGFAFIALGPALLGNSAKQCISQWSHNASNDFFMRGAAALAFGIWLSIVFVTMALVIERLAWLLTGTNGLLSISMYLFNAIWF